MYRSHRVLVALAVALVGCEAAVPPPDESSSEDERRRTEDYGPKVAHTIDGMKFDDPAHERLLRRLDSAARRLAGEGWAHESYRSRPTGQAITAMWANTLDEKRRGTQQHSIVVEAQRALKASPTILAVGVKATFAPADTGWGAYVLYYAPHDRVWMRDTRFSILFRHYPNGEFTWKASSLEVFKDLEVYTTRREFGGTEYPISVGKHPATTNAATRGDILPFLESAESLRDAALARLAELEARAKEEILSGKAVGKGNLAQLSSTEPSQSRGGGSRVTILRAAGRQDAVEALNRDHDSLAWARAAFVPPPPPSSREMTEEERKVVLQEAQAVLAQRKKLIRENYREMFDALSKAFPLGECLKAE
jgi:hypothetical protein